MLLVTDTTSTSSSSCSLPLPSSGYYLLSAGTTIREGDEYWNDGDGCWEATSQPGHKVGDMGCNYVYQRTLPGAIRAVPGAIGAGVVDEEQRYRQACEESIVVLKKGIVSAIEARKALERQRDTLTLTVEEQRKRIVALREENEVLVLEKAQLRAEVEALREQVQSPSGRKFSF